MKKFIDLHYECDNQKKMIKKLLLEN